MTTKSEWQEANRALEAEDRQRLGEPPAAEEVLAYMRGELPAHEAARVCERLVAYPELVRTLTAEFPAEGAEPGDPDYMPDDEFAKHWASLQRRMPRKEPGRVLQFWPAISAIAAALAIVFGALYWQARTERAVPLVADLQILTPDGRRGGGDEAVPLTAQGDFYYLVVSLPGTPVFDTHRLEIVDASANPPRSIWSTSVLPRPSSEIFPILVPRTFLKPGKYQVVLYGVSGAREERIDTYTVRVRGR